jgi:hypothetical protein
MLGAATGAMEDRSTGGATMSAQRALRAPRPSPGLCAPIRTPSRALAITLRSHGSRERGKTTDGQHTDAVSLLQAIV